MIFAMGVVGKQDLWNTGLGNGEWPSTLEACSTPHGLTKLPVIATRFAST